MRRSLSLLLLAAMVIVGVPVPAGGLQHAVPGVFDVIHDRNPKRLTANGRGGTWYVGATTPRGLGQMGPDGSENDRPYGSYEVAPKYLANDGARAVYYDDRERIKRFDVAEERVVTVLDATGRLCRGEDDPCGDGGPAADAGLSAGGLRGLDVGPDGSLYLADYDRVRRVTPDGRIAAVPGASDLPYLTGVAADADGSIVVLTQATVVRIRDGQRIPLTKEGLLGCMPPNPCGRGGAARDVRLGDPVAVDIGRDGTIYVAEHRSAVVSAITPDGRHRQIAGGWSTCQEPSPPPGCQLGGPAPLTLLNPIVSMTVSGDDLFLVDQNTHTGASRALRIPQVASVPDMELQRYRFLAGDGGVFNFGWAPFHGSTGGVRLAQPVVGGDATGPEGYYLVAADGGIFTFGDATFHGSAAGRTRSAVTGMAVTSDGRGYWVLEASGAVHALGSAQHGRGGTAPAGTRAVGIAADPDSGGYWIAFDNGTVQAVAAPHRGQAERPNRPIVGIAARPGGYWLVAADGGVFAFGSAAFHGSTGGMRLNRPVLGMVPTGTFGGYWLVAADGGVFTFGDAQFHGSTGGMRLNRPVVAVMAS